MQDSAAFVDGYAIQMPIWVVVPILAVVIFVGWKLAKAIWARFPTDPTCMESGETVPYEQRLDV